MITRPKSLREVAAESDSIAEFGRHLRDWLHELRRVSSRRQALAMIATKPRLLRTQFPEGHIADAWLGAYAEHLAQAIKAPAPAWAFAAVRTATEPLFDAGSGESGLRLLALAYSPAAFKRRNIYTPSVDLPLHLRPGRPLKSLAEKRANNAERQRRFRAARHQELTALRTLAKKATRS